MELIERIFFRKIKPSDFRNIYELAKPTSGGGQTYIEAAGIPNPDVVEFLKYSELSENTKATQNRYTYTILCRVLGGGSERCAIEFSPRAGRNFCIRRQTLGNRHPAWLPQNGFPEPHKGESGKYEDSPDFKGIIDDLVIFIIRTNHRKYYASFLNASNIPESWPEGIGLEAMFEGERRGIIRFEKIAPGLNNNKDNPFIPDAGELTTGENGELFGSSSTLLHLALRLFAERRVGEWMEAGREVNAKVRDYFAALTVETLAAFDDARIAELFCGVKGHDDKIAFKPMWSGGLGSAWSHIRPTSAAETQDVRDFLVRLRTSPGAAAEFRQDGFAHPKGFGPAVVSELLMKFHPESCFKHGHTTYEVLSWLGLVAFDHPFKNDFSDTDYKQVCGAAAKLLAAMREMKLPRSVAADGTGDGEEPDYLTVNEFVWFVNENKDLIKEESMKMKLETPDPKRKKAGTKTWTDVLSDKPDDLMNRLVAALLTKPFAILAGASGTGKSRMVRKLAYMTCLNAQLQPDPDKKKPIENFCMVPVKPNWHDSTDLLGYRSAVSSAHRYVSTDFVRFVLKAHAFPETPFFVCLDEMNLAPVEHYFAEFLSASETAHEEGGEFVTDPLINPGEFDGDVANLDPTGYAVPPERKALIERIGLYIPKNLFVVGTVNMDDSTSAFSRKVVDRAMTLEMDDVNYADLQKTSKFDLFDQRDDAGNLEAEGVLLAEAQIAAFVNRCAFRPESLQQPLVDKLTELKNTLHQTPLAIGYRFARECVQYRDAIRMLMAEKEGVDYDGFALDHLILMKVLPRLVGNKDDHADLIDALKKFFGTLGNHALSTNALTRMEKAADRNGGYLSFYP